MPRYIDADALLKAMDTWDKFGFSHSGAFVREPENDDYVPYVHYADMVKCVESMPTADVVEVVRCKECKHSIEDKLFSGLWCQHPTEKHCERNADFYCWSGERREDD